MFVFEPVKREEFSLFETSSQCCKSNQYNNYCEVKFNTSLVGLLQFRTLEALRKEHDAQIVHIATEAGLRISPDQWSSLLYGDLEHKSHMQSIIDKVG